MGEEYVFVSAQMLHVPHTWHALYLTSAWFIISVTVIWTNMYATFQAYKQWSFFFQMIYIRTKD